MGASYHAVTPKKKPQVAPQVAPRGGATRENQKANGKWQK
jgi:hypothetical protein